MVCWVEIFHGDFESLFENEEEDDVVVLLMIKRKNVDNDSEKENEDIGSPKK